MDWSSERDQRVLDFLQHAGTPAEIVAAVHDDPAYPPPRVGYGVRRRLAAAILAAKHARSGRRFTSVAQIARIAGVGPDTLHDIRHTIGDDQAIIDFFNGTNDRDEIVARIRDDPAYPPPRQGYGIGRRVAERILDAQARGGGRFGSVDEIGDVPGVGPDKLHDLRYSLQPPTHDYPVLLLPVRLETRFVEANGRKQLWVRIYPDDIAIQTHEPGLTDEEATAGSRWASSSEDEKRDRWREVAERFGPARARWIVRCFQDGGYSRHSGTERPMVYTLPDRFVVWLYRKDGGKERHEGNLIPDALPCLRDLDELAFSDADASLFDDDARWVRDFDAAVDVGMALRIDLEPGKDSFSRVIVVGYKSLADPDKGQALVEALFDNHRYTRGLSFLRHGAPTNNTGPPTNSAREGRSEHSDGDEDIERAYQLTCGGLKQPVQPVNPHRLGCALGIKPGRLYGLEGSEADQDNDSKGDPIDRMYAGEYAGKTEGATGNSSPATRMQKYFWLALGGRYFDMMLPGVLKDSQWEELQEHFALYVRARGPLPSLKIGNLPYGVLPVCPFDGWRPWDHEADFIMPGLHGALRELATRWRAVVADRQRVPRMGGPHDPDTQDPDKDSLGVLAMRSASASYHERPIIDDRLVAWLIRALHEEFFGKGIDDTTGLFSDYFVGLFKEDWDKRKQNAHAFLSSMFSAADARPPTNAYATRITSYGSGQAVAIEDLLGTLLTDAESHAAKTGRDVPDFPFPEGSFPDQATDLLRDALDLHTHRLDAWVTSLSTRRLDKMRGRRPQGILIGAYGWVENLEPRETLRGEYIHAPSLEQARAAAVHRSADITHRTAGTATEGADPVFGGRLSSNGVRRAISMGAKVAQGEALGVVLAAQFEEELDRIKRANVGLDLNKYREILAGAFPLSPEALAEPKRLDGAKLEEAWRETTAAEPIDGAKWSERTAADALRRMLQEQANQIEEEALRRQLQKQTDQIGAVPEAVVVAEQLDLLKDASGARSRLEMFESLFHSVNFAPERAAAALDAQSGKSAPSEIKSVRTVLATSSMVRRVCLVLSAGTEEEAAGWNWGYREIAEPALAAWAGTLLGRPSAIGCWATLEGQAEGAEPARIDYGTVKLDELGIGPLDFLYLSSSPASGGASELELRIAHRVRQSGVDPRAQIKIDLYDRRPTHYSRSMGEALEVAQHLLKLLDGGRAYLTPRHLLHPSMADEAGAFAAHDAIALEKRLSESLDKAVDKVMALRDALAGHPAPSDPERNIELLLQAARLGLKDVILSAQRLAPEKTEIDKKLAEAVTDLADRCKNCGGLLGKASTLRERQETDKAIGTLIQAAKALLGSEFVILPSFQLPRSSALYEALKVKRGSGAVDQPELRLSMQQAQERRPVKNLMDTLLVADIWRNAAVAGGESDGEVDEITSDAGLHLSAVEILAEDGEDPDDSLSLVCAHPVGLIADSQDADARVAGLFVDELLDEQPLPEVDTGVALRFDRPNSQAPQALLLAVPGQMDPKVSRHWTPEELLGIVEDTAVLMKIRAVDLDALAGDSLVDAALSEPGGPEVPEPIAPLFPALLLPKDADRPFWEGSEDEPRKRIEAMGEEGYANFALMDDGTQFVPPFTVPGASFKITSGGLNLTVRRPFGLSVKPYNDHLNGLLLLMAPRKFAYKINIYDSHFRIWAAAAPGGYVLQCVIKKGIFVLKSLPYPTLSSGGGASENEEFEAKYMGSMEISGDGKPRLIDQDSVTWVRQPDVQNPRVPGVVPPQPRDGYQIELFGAPAYIFTMWACSEFHPKITSGNGEVE